MKFFFMSFFLLFTFHLSGSHHVYVIHGYGSPKFVLNKITRNIKKSGFEATNYGYKSVTDDLEKIGRDLYLDIQHKSYDTISFVTHSMGGIVVRSMLKNINDKEHFPTVYRIVMMAPPNKGAEIADIYTSRKGFDPIKRPNMWKMRTDSDSYVNTLPIPSHSEVGVIVGYKGNMQGYNREIEGDNDGRVRPQSTLMGIEKDVAYIKAEHTFMTVKDKTVKLIIEFLKEGKFTSKEKHPFF
jgi:hypothetical protein